uniref:8-oxoguanine DNA glycosylase/AP lyase n=1 Tax=candidate division WOR-3 bacterium TaxID=2052148 RepID=A0A7C2P0L8_UNCW3
MNEIEKLTKLYENLKAQIEQRLEEFKTKKDDCETEILKEFIFCTLTPQSKAKVCWKAVENIFDSKAYLNPSEEEIKKFLKGVRFPNNKAKFVVQNLQKIEEMSFNLKEFVKGSIPSNEKRTFLVKNFKGIGMKEASHFLRNTGHFDLAILDRHILRNLLKLGVISSLPGTFTAKNYLLIEEKMRKFSNQIGIPFAHLDMLLWAKETGEVFK